MLYVCYIGDRPILDEAAETLKSNPNVKVEVNGYCDSIGTTVYNMHASLYLQLCADCSASLHITDYRAKFHSP